MSENEHAHGATQDSDTNIAKEQGRLLTSPADILSAEDIRFDFVDVPEWAPKDAKPGDPPPRVRVKSLTGRERGKAEQTLMTKRRNDKGKVVREQDVSNFYATLCVYGIVDAQGNRVFNDSMREKLGDKSSSAVTRIAEAIMKLSRMSDDEMDELVGNSEGDRGDTGSSISG